MEPDFWKNFFWANLGPKWPKIWVFWTFLEILSFVFFWFLAQWYKMMIPKKWRSPIFDKNFLGGNLGKKPSKNRVFWTLYKIASLVFSNFWQKDRGQCVLKNGWNNFSGKFFFVVNYGFSFFGEIPIDHFPISCFSRDWLIIFC